MAAVRKGSVRKGEEEGEESEGPTRKRQKIGFGRERD